MRDGKLYLLAEVLVKPEAMEETKAIFRSLLPTVLGEQGCEAMYTTTVEGDANKLVFFEIFSSEEAHRFHMAQAYASIRRGPGGQADGTDEDREAERLLGSGRKCRIVGSDSV